jgi:hypothetical protein
MFLVPVGRKPAAPAHKNDSCEEILYGIEGVLTWTVDGTLIEVGPGLKMLHRVRLKVRIAIVIRTMVKRERNRISPEMLAMPAFLKRIDFNAWTA